MASAKKAHPTFLVRLVGPQVSPDRLPFRTVKEVLSAVQDLASGRDPFESRQVPPEKVISLVRVRGGSAVYMCVSHAPDEARVNLSRVGTLLSSSDGEGLDEDRLIAAMTPIEKLSEIAKVAGCQIEVSLPGQKETPLFSIEEDVFGRVFDRLLLQGETTVVGRVERAGGATSMRCLLRVPDRSRGLYCNVASKAVVQRLGQHLYETIVARGTAVWIHRTWRIYRFTITDFTQPQLGDVDQTLEQLHEAGLKAWDNIGSPEDFIQELRS